MSDLPALYDSTTGEVMPLPADLTAVSLQLPNELAFDDWAGYGRGLDRMSGAIMWWIGDWWSYGELAYGDRQAVTAVGDDTDSYKFQTCMDAGWVARKFETSRRREVLPWSFHREVAAIDPADADRLLNLAVANKWTQRQLRQAKRNLDRPAPAITPGRPKDVYRAIVIDPPWPMPKIERDVRPKQGAHLDYPVMDITCQCEQEHEPDPEAPPCSIEYLPIPALADPRGCHLYLWTTHKFLPDALDLVSRWGGRYQCLMTWNKNVGITPFSWMYDTEHVVFANLGDGLDLQRKGLRLSMPAPVTRHSAKPDVFYERVLEASPEPRLEMFARTPRDGFTPWGNEVADAITQ